MRTAKLVVGTDGSPPSLTALRWAALEAQRRCVELVVVLAYNWRALTTRLLGGYEFREYIRDLATAIVDAAVAEVRTIAPKVRVRGSAVFGEPAPVLLDASDEADMVVVGSHCGGGVAPPQTGPGAGSLGVQLAARTCCPATVVVRGHDGRSGDPVVVGVDGSASAGFATGIAFEEAARRNCPIMAVRAHDARVRPHRADSSGARTWAGLEMALLGEVAGWHDKYPEVSVEHTIAKGSPAAVLTAWSRYAQLVVVGGPDHRPACRLPAGSVGRQLIRHADCPVLLARARAGI
ncbi:universal stress protein [Planosporangium thailandense]|uniref:Universal stress protein n=1 Tax=Planosporangium thailandense TaxID=765197 RepID=A0ABX0Y5A0_9ACTN|nr:universal stress protein [Planosporangium thailandense]NJC73312.1 universal stress protein [Planosporangium thailandense]